MAELTPEQSKHVESLINQFIQKKGLDRSEAIKQIHLFVCKGSCSWYKNSGGTGTGFDIASQTPEHLEEMEKLIDQLAEDRNVTKENLMKWFHVFRCHS